MDYNYGSSFTLGMAVLAALAVAAALLQRMLKIEKDPREPPFIPEGVPYIGHLIGMVQQGAKYYQGITDRFALPIYTLRTLNSRTYVVNSPELAAAVQRNSKTLTFNPIALAVSSRMSQFDKATVTTLRVNMNSEEGNWGVFPETHDMMYAILAPGPDLEDMNARVLTQLASVINALSPRQDGEDMKLWAWLRHTFTCCSSHAVYGPENPFATNPELEPAFWDFEAGLITLLVNVFPSITATKAYYGREAVLAALREYVEKERYRTASKLIQERIGLNARYGFSKKMQAHAELAMLFGSLVNAAPTCFWLLVQIFSRPWLLAEVRGEVMHCVSQESDGIAIVRTINVKRLVRECPMFNSTYREVLRFTASIASSRLALADTVISSAKGDSYLLKKGSVIQIQGGVIHADASVWGEDVKEFKPRRFLASPSAHPSAVSAGADEKHQTAAPEPKKLHPAAFRAFGGGSTLCPGRHFAQVEILSFVALFVAGFDVTAVDGALVVAPEKEETRIPLGIQKPLTDIDVRVKRRQGFEEVVWRFVN
ncbi:hypothetical protein LTR39_002231 [Cryomyces antarcticus]|nr:hypothetical protein LTR39_002231 [Cryomyces antarcticus]